MLPSLEIKNFRMLEDFRVEKLGRVNLIVGKNNSGKSSVLEALRIYAGAANRGLLEKIAAEHDEQARPLGAQGEDWDGSIPFAGFYTGRAYPHSGGEIVIGSTATDRDALTITYGFQEEIEEQASDGGRTLRTRFLRAYPEDGDPQKRILYCLRVTRGRQAFEIRLDHPSQSRRIRPEPINAPCSVIPTQFVGVDELADAWDDIALTDGQKVVTEALRIIAPEFEGLTFVRREGPGELRRTARVKLSTSQSPVTLGSLGDGMVRVLQLALKLFPAKGGFFLIDEFENGLHFSVQEQLWTLLFAMAAKLDVQLFATTHSWDCIESFARAAKATSGAEGVLFRVGRSVRASDRGKVIATVFDQEQLHNITQGDVEVR